MQKRPQIWPKEKKIRFSLPKQILIVYIIRFQKCFRPGPDSKNSPKAPKIVPKGPKSAKEVPNEA